MGFRIPFDINNNPIKPSLILSTRSGNKIGFIINVSSIVASDTLSDNAELSFRVDKYDNNKKCTVWDKLKNVKLVLCKEWDVWFETDIDIKDSSNEVYKSITCTPLCETELSNINLNGVEINTEDDIARDDYEIPTIVFDPIHKESSLLNRILEKAPHYTIAHVDDTLAKLQRTFTFNGISIKDALDQIAEEIHALVVYGNNSNDEGKPARTISLYDLESNCKKCGYRGEFQKICPECGSKEITNGYGVDTTIFVSKENLGENITFTSNKDQVKNCFYLEAGDDLMTATVRNCNPNGTSYIWHISSEDKEDMPIELVEKIDSYDIRYIYYKGQYICKITNNLYEKYNKVVEKYKHINKDLSFISVPITGYTELMNVLYDTIDLEMFLRDGLLPSIEISDTNAKEQALLLTSESLSPIAVSNIKSISAATADSSVLNAAKVIVNSNFKVKVKSSSFDKNSLLWSGILAITNYSDEEDYAETETITITIIDDYETYLRQLINKSLKKGDTENYSVSSLLKKDFESGEFASAIKNYGLTHLTEIHNCCNGCLDILIEQGVADKETWNKNLYDILYLDYYNKLSALENEMSLREKEIETVNDLYNDIESERNFIREKLNFQEFLGESLWKIFCSYRKESTYSNSNYISDGLNNAELFNKAREFISVAEKEIYKSSTLQHSISSTLKNLLVIKEFKKILPFFEVGNWIRIEVDGTIYKLRLIKYEIDFDNLQNINVEFSDVIETKDGITDVENIIDKARSISISYDYVERQASKGKESHDVISSWQNDGLDATLTKIINSAEEQSIVYDKSGLLFRKFEPITQSYYPEQMKAINSTIAMTDDNWQTTKTAIGKIFYVDPETKELKTKFGINAEVLIGKLIIGEELGIYNSNLKMKFDKDGLYITNDKNSVFINPNDKSILRLTKGLEAIFYVNTNGDVVLKGVINALAGGTIGGWNINDASLVASTSDGNLITLSNGSNENKDVLIVRTGNGTASSPYKYPVQIHADGSAIFDNAFLTGKIYATSGTIGGWELTSTRINCSKTISIGSKESGMMLINEANMPYILAQNSSGNKTFSIDRNGNVFIAGEVNASTGFLGCWKIDGNRMYDNSNAIGYTGVNKYGAGQAFWAGGTDLTGNNAPFHVNHDGHLVSTSAEMSNITVYDQLSMRNTNTGSVYPVLKAYVDQNTNYEGVVVGSDSFTFGVLIKSGVYVDKFLDVWGEMTANSVMSLGDIYTQGAVILDPDEAVKSSDLNLLRMYTGNSNFNQITAVGNMTNPTSIYTTSNVWKNGSSTTYFQTTSTSDKRLKEYVSDLSAYELFFKYLSPIAFRYHKGLYNAPGKSPLVQLGFYAQDVIKAFDKAGIDWHDQELVVIEDGELSEEELKYVDSGTLLKMNYQNFTALNTYMLQKLMKKIEDLEKRINQFQK